MSILAYLSNASRSSATLIHILQTLSVFLFLCLLGLLESNVVFNEVTKFTTAMYHTNPQWVPDLFPQGPGSNQPYRLFETLITPLLTTYGFLVTSVIGRLICYFLYACAFVLIATRLSLKAIFLLPITWMLYHSPSLVAGEDLFKFFEPKAISYGLVLLALGHLMKRQRSLSFLIFLLGIAASFHILVGLYGAFTVTVLIFVQRNSCQLVIDNYFKSIAIFLISTFYAWWTIAGRFLTADSTQQHHSGFSTSYLSVFYRNPHHNDPGFWEPGWWWITILFSGILLVSTEYNRRRQKRESIEINLARSTLFWFALISMLPFSLGIIISLYDDQGFILQYYPFRFGDVILPLCSLFLVATVIQSLPGLRTSSVVTMSVWLISFLLVIYQLPRVPQQLREVVRFPGEAQKISGAWLEICSWIGQNTPESALFVTPPDTSITFPWLARRRMLVSFKQYNLSGGLQEWAIRLSDIAGKPPPWEYRGFSLMHWMGKRYRNLHTDAADNLMTKYQANYFLTVADHRLNLPVIYSNEQYLLYVLPDK